MSLRQSLSAVLVVIGALALVVSSFWYATGGNAGALLVSGTLAVAVGCLLFVLPGRRDRLHAS